MNDVRKSHFQNFVHYVNLFSVEGDAMTPKIVRIRARNQITIPAEMLQGTPLQVGDYIQVRRVESGAIELMPVRLVTMGSAEAAQYEQLAIQDVRDGKYGTYDTAEEFTAAVRKRRRAKREKKVAAAAATGYGG